LISIDRTRPASITANHRPSTTTSSSSSSNGNGDDAAAATFDLCVHVITYIAVVTRLSSLTSTNQLIASTDVGWPVASSCSKYYQP